MRISIVMFAQSHIVHKVYVLLNTV